VHTLGGHHVHLKTPYAKLPPGIGRLNWRSTLDRILDLVVHHRCLGG
jgi:hypothetical protein